MALARPDVVVRPTTERALATAADPRGGPRERQAEPLGSRVVSGSTKRTRDPRWPWLPRQGIWAGAGGGRSGVMSLTMETGAASANFEIRLAADPASVPGARRFVTESCRAIGRPDLADVAELVVSELAGNAALHSGGQFMHITVATRAHGIRVAVEDDGPVGTEKVAPSAFNLEDQLIDIDGWEDQPTTGRGLAIVSMLAAEWGADPSHRGKQVWADLADPDIVREVRPPVRTPASGQDLETSSILPPGWSLVRLVGCPVALSLRQDQHLDELIRELQLLAADPDNHTSGAIASQIEHLLISPAHARLTGRRSAQRALSDGLDAVDVEMAMPHEFGVLVRQLHDAVTRADELCENNQMLALASPAQVRELRAWMTHEIIAQLEDGQAPTPWNAWGTRAAEQPAPQA